MNESAPVGIIGHAPKVEVTTDRALGPDDLIELKARELFRVEHGEYADWWGLDAFTRDTWREKARKTSG